MTTIEDIYELNMMTGNFHEVQSNEDAVKAFDYILKAMDSKATGKEVLNAALRYNKTGKIQGYSTSTLMGEFQVINIVFQSKAGKPVKLVNANGNPKDTFAYVYNIGAPDCSELGYIYFEQRRNGTYHRV